MKILSKKNNSFKEFKNFTSKSLVIGGLMAIITMGAFAQNQKREFKKSELTPEQVAELQTKKMTLGLELTEAQQKEVYNLKKDQAIIRESKRKEMMALREKGEKPINKNSFERRNSRLDAQLAHQKEMKNILNEGQYETWKKSRKHKAHQMKKMRKHKKIRQHARAKKRH